jgi:hypothetical protein
MFIGLSGVFGIPSGGRRMVRNGFFCLRTVKQVIHSLQFSNKTFTLHIIHPKEGPDPFSRIHS